LASRKIQKYLLANSSSKKFELAIATILDYLQSEENLYPQAETEALEFLCSVDMSVLTVELRAKILKLAMLIARGDRKRSPLAQSEFSRVIAFYLMYKTGDFTNNIVAEDFLKLRLPDYSKKCAALVGLTVDNDKTRKGIIDKLRQDSTVSMKRVLSFIENMDKNKRKKVVLDYLKQDKFFILFKPIDGNGRIELTAPYKPVRIKILEDLIQIYG